MERAYGLQIPQSLEEACDRRRTSLLVYDMQVGIISQLKDGTDIVARIKFVLDAARAAGLRIFFTRHMSLPKEASGVFQLRIAMAWQRFKRWRRSSPGSCATRPDFRSCQNSPRLRAK